MRAMWLTDLHLDFLEKHERETFYARLKAVSVDCFFITGDIANAACVEGILIEMALALSVPIYFVLGNHDYYGSSVGELRSAVKKLCAGIADLYWMGSGEAVSLSPSVLLAGHDTWADGRNGSFHKSAVRLRDEKYIVDLIAPSFTSRQHLLGKMQELADRDCLELREQIVKGIALHSPRKVVILSHVPPFAQVCLYDNKASCDNYLPFYTSKANGDLFLELAMMYPHIEFSTFSGHTHHKAAHQSLGNLWSYVGHAKYEEPSFCEVLEL